MNEIWDFSAMIQPHYDRPIVPCITINLPKLNHPWTKRQGHINARFRIYQSSQKGYYFTKHEYKQSRHNFDMEVSSSLEMLFKQISHSERMLQRQTKSIKKAKYDCYEENSMYFTECIDEFYAEQLQCYLPWTKPNQDWKIKSCQTAEDLDKYRNLADSITSPNMTSKIKEKGCFKPNCMKTTWVKDGYHDQSKKSVQSQVYIAIPYTAKVIQRQEILLADFSTFLVDFGSYLGLFLGASALSLTDIAISQIWRFWKTITK